MSSLFTFVLEYDGGIYISQYRGRTVREALRRWARSERTALTGQWELAVVEELFTRIVEETPVALQEAVHAWCVSTLAARKLVLLNIVRTAE